MQIYTKNELWFIKLEFSFVRVLCIVFFVFLSKLTYKKIK
jgi:hypothetical protein